jgi:hypothetical protein
MRDKPIHKPGLNLWNRDKCADPAKILNYGSETHPTDERVPGLVLRDWYGDI